MTGIEKITSRVIAEGEHEAGEICRAAEEQAAGIRAAADMEAESLLNKARADAEKEAARRAELILASAETEAKKSLLSMKQEMISRAFGMALDKLLSLDRDDYIAMLARLAAEASETGDEEIILNEHDAEAFGMEIVIAANRIINGTMTLSHERRKIKGGLILKHGKIELNCALETLVALSKNELSGKIAEMLFSE
jgi:V/A-type H+-transporting ATPase subunit E